MQTREAQQSRSRRAPSRDYSGTLFVPVRTNLRDAQVFFEPILLSPCRACPCVICHNLRFSELSVKVAGNAV
ncbi:hypothetical protein KCP69_07660 [Salmonella enterica subsp. enterica]|nr:hypothetical protein KCP69_07660 [Salmonella enterica subsp. enterica]